MRMSPDSGVQVDGQGRRVAVVVARFNREVTDKLCEGAFKKLLDCGVHAEAIEVFEVPGAFELPLACKLATDSGRFDALVALGAVIRGDTDHYVYVCAETSRGIAELQLRTRVPIGFGLLTCDTPEQAMARAGGSAGNKGEDAALAALEMCALRARLAAD